MSKTIATNSEGKALSVSFPVFSGVLDPVVDGSVVGFDTILELRSKNFLANTLGISDETIGIDLAIRVKLAFLQAIDNSLLAINSNIDAEFIALLARLPGALTPNGYLPVSVVETGFANRTVNTTTTATYQPFANLLGTHVYINNPNSVAIAVQYSNDSPNYFILGAGQSDEWPIGSSATELRVGRLDAIVAGSGTFTAIPVSYRVVTRK